MPTTQTITAHAGAKTGMTLAELAAFVEEARRAGVGEDATVRPDVSLRGRLRGVEVTG